MTGNEEIDALRAEVAMLRQMVASMAESGQMIGETMQAVQLGGCGGCPPRCYDISESGNARGNLINTYVMNDGIIVPGPTANVYNSSASGKIVAIRAFRTSGMYIQFYNDIHNIRNITALGDVILPLYKMKRIGERYGAEIDFRKIPKFDTWSFYSAGV